MGFLKFMSFEVGVVLLIALLSAVVGVFGFGNADPKFDPWGNIGLRVFLSAVAAIVVVGAIGGVLFFSKHLPVTPKAAAVFAILFGIYLEIYRILVDRYAWSTGSMWLPILSMILIPAVLGSIFFMRVRFEGS